MTIALGDLVAKAWEQASLLTRDEAEVSRIAALALQRFFSEQGVRVEIVRSGRGVSRPRRAR